MLADAAEDITFVVFALIGGGVGAYATIQSLHSLRVLLAAPFWPKVEARVESVRIERKETVKPRDPGEDSDGFFGKPRMASRVVTREFWPVIKFRYELRGKRAQADNLAPWNIHTFSTMEDARADLARVTGVRGEEGAARSVNVRANPHTPGEILISFRRWPWFWAPLKLLLSVVPMLLLAPAANDIAKLCGGEMPRWFDRPVSIFVGLAWPILWLAGGVFLSSLPGREWQERKQNK